MAAARLGFGQKRRLIAKRFKLAESIGA